MLANLFHTSEASAGLTISAATLGVAISALLLALCGERLPRKKTIVFSMTALAITCGLTALGSSLMWLAFWRFVQGLLTPGIFIISIAYITEEWPPLQVPRVMSIYVAGTVFGGFIGRVVGGTIAAYVGWRILFLALGLAGAIGAAVTQRLLWPPTLQKDSGKFSFGPMLTNLRNPRLLVTYGIGFCMLFMLVSVFSYITFYLAAAPFHLSTTALSALFTVYLVGLVVTLGAGTVLARVGLRIGMLTAVSLCFTGVLVTLIPSLVAVGIGLSLTSSGVFIAQTCANSFLRDAAPAGTRVSAAGLYICSYYIGGTVGGVVPGLFYGFYGWPICAAMICMLLIVAGTLTFYGWRSHTPVPEPVPV